MSEKKAYSQAFHTGKYDKATGLLGKYDNVRRFWEDQVTAIFLRPALNELVEHKSKRLERVRVLDLAGEPDFAERFAFATGFPSLTS